MSVIEESIIKIVISHIQRQGLSLVLLCLAVYFGYLHIGDLRTEVRECNEEVKEFMMKDHEEMRQVINRNTVALEKLLSQ